MCRTPGTCQEGLHIHPRSLVTSFDPMSPLPPMTTIFMMGPFCIAACPKVRWPLLAAAEGALVVEVPA